MCPGHPARMLAAVVLQMSRTRGCKQPNCAKVTVSALVNPHACLLCPAHMLSADVQHIKLLDAHQPLSPTEQRSQSVLCAPLTQPPVCLLWGVPAQLHLSADVQHIKPKDGTQPNRTKVTVSDGVYKCTALLASQLRELVENGAISKFALLRVTELVGNKKLGNTAGNKK